MPHNVNVWHPYGTAYDLYHVHLWKTYVVHNVYHLIGIGEANIHVYEWNKQYANTIF